MNFSDDIKKLKPTISLGSLKTYSSLLKTIHSNVFAGQDGDLKNFNKSKEVMEFISSKAYNTRKTYLAALVAVCPDIPIYRNQMNEDIKTYRAEVSKSENTDKLEESAISQEEIETIYNNLKATSKLLMKKKDKSINDLMQIQEYVLLSMYYGHILPRRATDYILMKHKNFDKKEDNYVDFENDRLVFNKYKTATKMGSTLKGRQELDLPSSLRKILKKWIAVIPEETDYLFFNNLLNPLSNVSLNQRLNKIFDGRNVGVNALRHFYLTKTYSKLMKENEEMADTMDHMGSSSAQAKVYIKIHDKE